MADVLSGLRRTGEDDGPGELIPLVSIKISAIIKEVCTEVQIEQQYENREDIPIEAVYLFPLSEQAAVCSFSAKVGGREVIGVVKPQAKAQEEYDTAVASGHGAYLMRQTAADMFEMKVGNLLPGASVTVKLSYVTTLSVADNKIRFLFPTHLFPRYGSPSTSYPSASSSSSVKTTVFDPKHLPYTADFFVSMTMCAPIAKITSPSHSITVKRAESSKTEATVSCNKANPGVDFVLDVLFKHHWDPVVMLERSTTLPRPSSEEGKEEEKEEGSGEPTVAALLSFLPQLRTRVIASEIILVLDRSGSMGGPSISAAKRALMKCIDLLPEECTFNVVSFGSNFSLLFTKSEPADSTHKESAKKSVNLFKADMGGTELLRPLTAILTSAPSSDSMPRQIFLLTDGGVSDTDRVVSLVRTHSHTTRVFTFGIGSGVSTALVSGVARAGGGTATFISTASFSDIEEDDDDDDDGDTYTPSSSSSSSSSSSKKKKKKPQPVPMMEEVASTVRKALSPSLVGVDVDLGEAQRYLKRRTPHRLRPIFSGDHYHVYCLFSADVLKLLGGKKGGKKGGGGGLKVTLTAQGSDGKFTATASMVEVADGLTVHRLAAREMIREYEEECSPLHDRKKKSNEKELNKKIEEDVTTLSVQFSVLSKYTAFIAIEHRDPAEKKKGKEKDKEKEVTPVRREVPHAAPTTSFRSGHVPRRLRARRALASALDCDFNSKRRRRIRNPNDEEIRNPNDEEIRNPNDEEKVEYKEFHHYNDDDNDDNDDEEEVITTPFGFSAVKVKLNVKVNMINQHQHQQSCLPSGIALSHAMLGPRTTDRNCWMHAALALLFTIPPVREILSSPSPSSSSSSSSLMVENQLVILLGSVYHAWIALQPSSSTARRRNDSCARRTLTTALIELREWMSSSSLSFPLKEEQSAARAVHVFLNCLFSNCTSGMSNVQAVQLNQFSELSTRQVGGRQAEYVVALTQSNPTSLPYPNGRNGSTLRMHGYSLHSVLAHEELRLSDGESCTHSLCFAWKQPDDVYVFDDTVHFEPNGQGGRLSADRDTIEAFVEPYLASVTVAVLRRSD